MRPLHKKALYFLPFVFFQHPCPWSQKQYCTVSRKPVRTVPVPVSQSRIARSTVASYGTRTYRYRTMSTGMYFSMLDPYHFHRYSMYRMLEPSAETVSCRYYQLNTALLLCTWKKRYRTMSTGMYSVLKPFNVYRYVQDVCLLYTSDAADE